MKKSKNKNLILFVLPLMGQLGFLIAVPAVLFGFGGAYLDRALDTEPIFVLVGLGVAIASSSALVYQLIRRMDQ